MPAPHAQRHVFKSDSGRPLVFLNLLGFLCLVIVSLAACSSAPKSLRSTTVPPVAPSPTPSQNVFVHLIEGRQIGHLAAGNITLYVTLTLTNARSAQIGLLSSCWNFDLLDQQGDLLWDSGSPCILSNYDMAEVQPGHTYTIEKDVPAFITVSKGLEAGTFVLRAGYFRWHEGPNVPGTPITGAQGDASGQASVELS
jgi:hypothetical protein